MKKEVVMPSKPQKAIPPVAKNPIPVKVVAPKIDEHKAVIPKVGIRKIEILIPIEPVDTTPTVADLKASLNDIPAKLRTQEVWNARLEAHRSTYGYDVVGALVDSRYFDKWIKA